MVSQSEVESLLSQIGDSSQESQPTPSAKAESESETVQPYAFRQLSAFAPSQLRKLRVRHEGFIWELAARLSVHLRSEIVLRMARLETMSFAKFVNELGNPTYLALLELQPLNGICLLDIPSQLGLSIVDRELGGEGVCGEEERALTEIEARILSKVVEITISEWCSCWRETLDLKPTLVGHESNAAFFQNYTPETSMLVLGIEMQIGQLSRQMHFGFPYQALEPLIQKLDSETRGRKKPVEKTQSLSRKWNPVLDDVPIKVSAELPSVKITAKELAKLRAGDVISLDPESLQHVRISLEQKPKFGATLGRCGTRWAVQISKVIDS